MRNNCKSDDEFLSRSNVKTFSDDVTKKIKKQQLHVHLRNY